MKSFTTFITEQSCEGPFCYRLDRNPIEKFQYNSYLMHPSGSSEVLPKGFKPEQRPDRRYFEGLYAGKDLSLIAGYALPSNVPWTMAYHTPDGKNPLGLHKTKPTIFIHREHYEAKHPPVYLSRFNMGDFAPRHEITAKFFGLDSTDRGDDEYVSVGSTSPTHLSQEKIDDPIKFLHKHVDIKIIEPKRDGSINHDGMEAAIRGLHKANSGETPHYSMIMTDGRGETSIA